MDHDALQRIPLIRLDGIREITLERTPCSLIFEFIADDAPEAGPDAGPDASQSLPPPPPPSSPAPRMVPLRIAEFVQIVAHLQSEGAIPELPWDWIHQMEGSYGFCLQTFPEEPQDSPDLSGQD